MVSKWMYLVCVEKGLFNKCWSPVKLFTSLNEAQAAAKKYGGVVFQQKGDGELTLHEEN